METLETGSAFVLTHQSTFREDHNVLLPRLLYHHHQGTKILAAMPSKKLVFRNGPDADLLKRSFRPARVYPYEMELQPLLIQCQIVQGRP